MTRQDIIETAFRVWGRQLYQSTSLTDVARELGVSKPALYRHFKNKEALFDALFENFFDRYAASLKPAYEKAIAVLPNESESFSIIVTAITEYFIRNIYDFVFSIVEVFGNKDMKNMARLLAERGVDMGVFTKIKGGTVYPSNMRLIMATVTFFIERFHKRNLQTGETPTNERIEEICRFIVQKVKFGMEFDRETIERIEKMNYEALEHRITEMLKSFQNEENRGNKGDRGKNLLDAVASAVAEAGPWKVSMDLAARKSGLSKSSLYCHFTSKDDMLERFFVTEFDRLVNVAERAKALSDKPEEQFYLVIAAIGDYLRSRPDILETINWLKTLTDEFMINWRRVRGEKYDAEETFRNPRFSALFSDIFSKISVGAAGIEEYMGKFLFPNIVPFLVVNILMNGGGGYERDFRPFRVLFKFLTLGFSNKELGIGCWDKTSFALTDKA
jgi:AcrR family transcriptional regulator